MYVLFMTDCTTILNYNLSIVLLSHLSAKLCQHHTSCFPVLWYEQGAFAKICSQLRLGSIMYTGLRNSYLITVSMTDGNVRFVNGKNHPC